MKSCPVHYVDVPCGVGSGLPSTTDPARVTCKSCLRVLAAPPRIVHAPTAPRPEPPAAWLTRCGNVVRLGDTKLLPVTCARCLASLNASPRAFKVHVRESPCGDRVDPARPGVFAEHPNQIDCKLCLAWLHEHVGVYNRLWGNVLRAEKEGNA